MQKPYIGITVGEIINGYYPWSPVILGQAHTYIDAVVHAGGIPIEIPLCDDEDTVRRLYELCDGLLMSGGNDINPDSYASTHSDLTVNIAPARDNQELKLLAWAEKDDKPMLGICRGMQLYNAFKGGTLYQDLEAERPDTHNHHASIDKKDMLYIAHKLKIDPTSNLASIVQSKLLPTNSHHHQGIKDLASGLTANAWAEDGVIEGLESKARTFAIGVQSHPEALEPIEPRWRALFVSLIKHANQYGLKT